MSGDARPDSSLSGGDAASARETATPSAACESCKAPHWKSGPACSTPSGAWRRAAGVPTLERRLRNRLDPGLGESGRNQGRRTPRATRPAFLVVDCDSAGEPTRRKGVTRQAPRAASSARSVPGLIIADACCSPTDDPGHLRRTARRAPRERKATVAAARTFCHPGGRRRRCTRLSPPLREGAALLSTPVTPGTDDDDVGVLRRPRRRARRALGSRRASRHSRCGRTSTVSLPGGARRLATARPRPAPKRGAFRIHRGLPPHRA